MTELFRIFQENRQNCVSPFNVESDWKCLLDSITDMITIHDKDFNVIYANTSAKRFLELPSSGKIKFKCYTYYHGTNSPPEKCASCQCLKTGSPATVEVFEPYLKKNIEIRAIPQTNGKNKVTGLIHIVRDITERIQREEELKDTSRRLHDLTLYLQNVRESERKHIAREIHDELAQTLTTLKMKVSWLNSRIPVEQAPLHKEIQTISSLLERAVNTVHTIVEELRPGLLDTLGLKAAICWKAEEFQRQTGIRCDFTCDSGLDNFDQERGINIFRLIQEAMTNISRHAHASKIRVAIKEKNNLIEITVRDNGIGITEEQLNSPRSFGILGMKERVFFLRGKLKISRLKGKGTSVKAIIPVTIADGNK